MAQYNVRDCAGRGPWCTVSVMGELESASVTSSRRQCDRRRGDAAIVEAVDDVDGALQRIQARGEVGVVQIVIDGVTVGHETGAARGDQIVDGEVGHSGCRCESCRESST